MLVFLLKNDFLNLYIFVWGYVHVFGYPKRPEEDVILPHARVMGSCEPPYCGFWKLNVDPLEKQEMLFTTEPSHHPLIIFNSTKGTGNLEGLEI